MKGDSTIAMLKKDVKSNIISTVENMLNEVKENNPDDFTIRIDQDRNCITIECTQVKQKYIFEGFGNDDE